MGEIDLSERLEPGWTYQMRLLLKHLDEVPGRYERYASDLAKPEAITLVTGNEELCIACDCGSDERVVVGIDRGLDGR